ncbi:MAG: hypothetical protein AAGJ95_04255 [Cyanobacteria bacterium J06554_11]
MSISPFKPQNRPLEQLQTLLKKRKSKKDPSPQDQLLTLPQALTITAGMAGLIGLISGVVMRFSFIHSSNARFLSPLQTFPALADWAPAIPQEATDTDRPVDSQSGTAPISNFDSFADRAPGRSSAPVVDPLQALSDGPLLRESGPEEHSFGEANTFQDSFYEDSSTIGGEDAPIREASDGRTDYFDDAYSEPFIDGGSADIYNEMPAAFGLERPDDFETYSEPSAEDWQSTDDW